MTEGQLRGALSAGGLEAEVTTLRSEDLAHPDWMVKLQTADAETVRSLVDAAFASAFPGNAFELRSMHNIGPRVGKELTRAAIWSTIWVSILLVIYVSVRFEFIYSVGAIVATLHDVFVVLLFFSLFGLQFSLAVLAAILTLVGYSINDTIVVYDRIREQVKKQRGAPYTKVVNDAINQTLSRTVLTGATTIISVVILIFFGGQTLTTMAVALLIGVLTGTYSSVFIAAPILIEWHDRRAAKLALSK
jgi:preprotein translocase SecF subunit